MHHTIAAAKDDGPAVDGAFFQRMDALRRAAGSGMDSLGLGPQPVPSRVLHEAAGVRLRRYEGSGEGPALLVVPSPIKAHWIWDLAPECSVVRAALARGCQVHLMEWTSVPASWGLDEHVAAVAHAAAQVRGLVRHRPHLLGHSLGGTLAALCAARHAQDAASLALVEAPLCFGSATGALADLVSSLPPGFARRFDHVPGSLVGLAASKASPEEFSTGVRQDALASALHGPRTWRRHWLAVRWTLEERPLSGRLVAQVMDALYREDRFMRGTLCIDGQCVAPSDVAVPVAAIVDPRSRVVPAASVTGFVEAAASPATLLLQYGGDVGVALQHLGALIGDSAHRELWPRVLDWLQELDRGRGGNGARVASTVSGESRP